MKLERPIYHDNVSHVTRDLVNVTDVFGNVRIITKSQFREERAHNARIRARMAELWASNPDYAEYVSDCARRDVWDVLSDAQYARRMRITRILATIREIARRPLIAVDRLLLTRCVARKPRQRTRFTPRESLGYVKD